MGHLEVLEDADEGFSPSTVISKLASAWGDTQDRTFQQQLLLWLCNKTGW